MLLNETEKDNLFVRAWKLYVRCEFFQTEPQVLAYFTHKVTLAFFHYVQQADQTQLL